MFSVTSNMNHGPSQRGFRCDSHMNKFHEQAFLRGHGNAHEVPSRNEYDWENLAHESRHVFIHRKLNEHGQASITVNKPEKNRPSSSEREAHVHVQPSKLKAVKRHDGQPRV